MGSRCVIVVIESGVKRKYYTHWGGQSVHLDLLPGPAAAVRFATAQQSVDNWVADLEAAAVIDLDQRVLLWYSDSCDDAALRCGVLATMKDTWQDWVVYWAPAGDQDVVDYCAGRWRACAVIVIEDGRNRHYRTALSLTTLIGTGPALVDVVSEWEAAARPLVLPPRAVVLVPAERVGAHWALDDSAEDIDVVSAGWGEWTGRIGVRASRPGVPRRGLRRKPWCVDAAICPWDSTGIRSWIPGLSLPLFC